MTEKLFENDAYLWECDAVVTACESAKKGYAAELDRTVFFPEGGGQLSDRGKLGDAVVTHVAEEGGRIWHYCDKPLEVGSTVKAVVDGVVRLDHMQQHCGEHILSYAAWKLFGANNIGFHMSEGLVTIDLDKELTADELAQAEDFANREIWLDKPISVSYVPHTDLDKYTMRKKNTKLTGTLRLVSVEDGDICTCCGTHPRRTGAVGIIHITNAEKHKQGQRISFLCGRWALMDVRSKNAVIRKTGQMLSVKPEQVPDAVARLQNEITALNARIKEKTMALYDAQLPQFLSTARALPDGSRLVVVTPEDATAADAKLLLQKVTAMENLVVGVVYEANGRVNYMFGHSDNVNADCREYCKKANELFNGRGGGKTDFAQGSGTDTADWQHRAHTLLL